MARYQIRKQCTAARPSFQTGLVRCRPSPAEDEAALSHPRIRGQAADAYLALPLTVAFGVKLIMGDTDLGTPLAVTECLCSSNGSSCTEAKSPLLALSTSMVLRTSTMGSASQRWRGDVTKRYFHVICLDCG